LGSATDSDTTVNTAMPRLSSRQQGLLPTSVRLRPNLCLWVSTLLWQGAKLHGDKFKLSDSSTWSEAIEVEDQSWGQVKIQQWLGLHFRAAAAHQVQLLRIVVSGKSGSVPQAHVVGLVRWRHALFGADMATLPPQVCGDH